MSFVSIIPLLLSGLLLGEWRALNNAMLTLGFLLAVFGIGLHIRREYLNARQTEAQGLLSIWFYPNALAFTIIFGIGTYLENVWAKSSIPPPDFLASWYIGTCVGALAMFIASRKLPHVKRNMGSVRELALSALAGTSIVVSLWFAFISFGMVEQTIVLPVYAVADIVGYVLVGIVIFREWRTLKGNLVNLALGILGALLIVLSR